MLPETSERSLVLRAQSGDRGAFDALLRTTDHDLLRYVTRLVDNRPLAEDMVQEVMITIVRKIAWLRDPALFRPWCFRIASRAAFRALRKERVFVEVSDAADATVEIDPLLRERVAEGLPRVSAASRAVILLHYFEEMSLSDVAAVLDLNPGTVKSRLAYGLAQLRKELA